MNKQAASWVYNMVMRIFSTSRSGFTLVEVLVVSAIISILYSIMLVSTGESRMLARDAQRMAETDAIATALNLYYLENGHYPCSAAERSSANGFLKELVDDKYLPKKPEDPINTGVYRYYYKSMRDTAGSDCGEYAFLNYDKEHPSTECILGGKFVPEANPDAKHCHIPLPGPLPCANPWLEDESPAGCALVNDSG